MSIPKMFLQFQQPKTKATLKYSTLRGATFLFIYLLQSW